MLLGDEEQQYNVAQASSGARGGGSVTAQEGSAVLEDWEREDLTTSRANANTWT